MFRLAPDADDGWLAPDADLWMRDAACIEHPEISWFPSLGESADPAKEICRRCLCQRECLELALTADFRDGIWGATSARERAMMRKAKVSLAGALEATESRLQKERRLDADARASYVEEPDDDEPWML